MNRCFYRSIKPTKQETLDIFMILKSTLRAKLFVLSGIIRHMTSSWAAWECPLKIMPWSNNAKTLPLCLCSTVVQIIFFYPIILLDATKHKSLRARGWMGLWIISTFTSKGISFIAKYISKVASKLPERIYFFSPSSSLQPLKGVLPGE